MKSRRRSLLLPLVLMFVLPVSSPVSHHDNTFSSSSRMNGTSEKKWSSMFSVNPDRVLSVLVERGGLFIPKSAEDDIKLLRQFVHVDSAELNVVEKHLILNNFTIGIKNEKHALRIGRVYIHWSSYSEPCLHVEVDDVDLLVEFSNLLLTKNNWDGLKEAGFPPSSWWADQVNSEFSDLLRFASIDLSGRATVRVTSAPLNEEIGAFSLDMATTNGLSDIIRQKSVENQRLQNIKGISSAELATLLQKFFERRIRTFLADRLQDVASNPESFRQESIKLFEKARGTILNYAAQAGKKSQANIEEAIATKIDDIGIEEPHERLRALKTGLLNVIEKVDVQGVVDDLLSFRHKKEPKGSTNSEKEEDDSDFDFEITMENLPPDL